MTTMVSEHAVAAQRQRNPQNRPAAPGGAAGIPFTVASRPQRRYANTQTVANAAAGSFAVIQLPATGWVRRVSLYFKQVITFASGAALVAGDGPFNLLSNITITDATGQAIQQPISGYHLYLVNKYLPNGNQTAEDPTWRMNPQMGPEFDFSVAGGTAGTAIFRLDIDFEIDAFTGYGCVPNLDSNASLQLKVDYAAASVAFTGTTPSAQALTMTTEVEYWAPVGNTVGGHPVMQSPPGAGDYLETRYETKAVSASSENLVDFTNRGGLVKGVILISKAAGTRTAITAASNLGFLLDNQPINEGIPIESHYNQVRRMYGYLGADLTTTYAPLTAGVLPGLDRGVAVMDFAGLAAGRQTWLNTRGGSLFQSKITPGASATTLEVITQLMQVKHSGVFYRAD